MKKRNVSLLSILLLSSLFSLSMSNVNQPVSALTNTQHILRANDSSSWSATGGNYSIDGGVITLSSNTAKNSNYYLTDQYNTLGDYTVSVSSVGTKGFPMSSETDIGIVPWYIDSNNYILVYLNWSNTDRPSELREIQITGRINGKVLTVKNGSSWTQKEWNDFWTDGQAIKENTVNTLKVSKKRSSTNDSDLFTVTLNDNLTKTLEIRDTVQFDNVKPKVGVYGYNDTITFSDFAYSDDSTSSQFKNVSDGVGRSENGSLSYTDGTYSIDSKSSPDALNNIALLTNSNSSGGYKINASVSVTEEADEGAIALVPYYENEYSYLTLGIKKEGGKLYAYAKGKRVTSMSTSLTFDEVDEKAEISDISSLSEITSLTISKSDGTFNLLANGNDKVLYTYTNAYYVQGNNSFPTKLFGFACAGVKATITGLSSSASYAEYSVLTKKLGGKDVFVSARNEDSVSYDGGTYIFSENAVTLNDSTKHASIYYASGKYGNINISATFSSLSESSSFGFYSYLYDINNYVKSYIDVAAKKLIVEKVVDGTLTKTEAEISQDLTDSHTLSSTITNQKLTISLGEDVILADESVTINLHEEAKVGFLGGGASFQVSNVKVSGFSPLDPIDVDDFTFFGQRVDSWNYDQENKVISNQVISGIDNGWKATNALYKNTETKDLYMGACIQVNERTGNEWKVGLMPYYKDADNHVIVWFSQWSDGGCKIVITARLNGQTVGAEWRESGDIGVNMLEKNYLETRIQGNKVSVYLNKGFTPIYETTIDGLENRNMELAFTGFQSGNGIAATYSEFTMVSDKRIYGFTEKPVILETGTRKTTGNVGTLITLPIYTAENSIGDFLTPVVKVTDPNNNDVTVSKNRFTPEKAGTYHVNVTCTDSWGNEADPIDYDIVVSEGYVDPDNKTSDNDTSKTTDNNDNKTSDNSEQKKGCGGSIAIASSLIGSIALLGTGLVIKKKKEK